MSKTLCECAQSWRRNSCLYSCGKIHSQMKDMIKLVREANSWFWGALNMYDCVPNWDEWALSNRYNAAILAAFFLQRITVQGDNNEFTAGKANNWSRRDLNTQPSDLESDALEFRRGVDAQRFVSDKFLRWKNSKIMAKPIKRRMKNIWRPLDLKIYICNCSSQLSSSWVRRFANVPKVEEEIVVCIRVVRFTHKWRKWSNWWEKRIPDLEEFWTCTNVFRMETR